MPTADRTLAYNPPVSLTSHAAAPDGSQLPPSERAVGDRCPGVLRLIEAADGHLARVRLPGGFVTAGQLRVLARLASEMGDGRVKPPRAATSSCARSPRAAAPG